MYIVYDIAKGPLKGFISLSDHQNQKQNAWSINLPSNLQQLPGVL